MLRAEQGWTQAELGARVGVSRQTINAYEKGRYEPSLSTAFELARVFEKKVAEVFLPDPPQAIPTAFHELGRTL